MVRYSVNFKPILAVYILLLYHRMGDYSSLEVMTVHYAYGAWGLKIGRPALNP